MMSNKKSKTLMRTAQWHKWRRFLIRLNYERVPFVRTFRLLWFVGPFISYRNSFACLRIRWKQLFFAKIAEQVWWLTIWIWERLAYSKQFHYQTHQHKYILFDEPPNSVRASPNVSKKLLSTNRIALTNVLFLSFLIFLNNNIMI